MAREQFLRLYLRLVGTVAATAAFCALMPFSWMDVTHQALGMGTLPDKPIIAYLARSTSAFYALLGGYLWVLSFDLKRYHPLIRYTGSTVLLLGILLFWVDLTTHLPFFWRIGEGPVDMLLGTVMLRTSRPPATGVQKKVRNPHQWHHER